MAARVATSPHAHRKNGTVQDPKGHSLRLEGPKNETEGRGGSGVFGEGAVKLNFGKIRRQKNHLVTSMSLNFMLQFHHNFAY